MVHSLRSSAAALALSAAFVAAPARAEGIASCGNINVEASEKCEVKVSGGCVAACTPITFQAACAAKLEGSCETKCNKLPEVSCTGSCMADCNAECTVKPATFDCEGTCTADCSGKCTGKCNAMTTDGGASADCEAECKATCSGSCHGSCTGTPAMADCSGKCEASCKGQCTADVNLDCQTKCQGDGFVRCQADLEGGCKVQCMDPKGAVFCNGQYVDHGGNAQECIDALNAFFKAHGSASVSGTSSCSGNTCSAEGQAKAKVSCHVSTPAQHGDETTSGVALIGLLGMIGAARMRRR